jgi:hypothetical protein
MIRSLVLVAVASASVRADPVEPHGGVGAQVGVGAAFASGIPTGWLVRFENDVLPVFAPPDTIGPFGGLSVGWEYWRVGPGTWGTDFPAQIVVGLRVPPFRARVGAGVDTLLLDRVRDVTGLGIYAPMAATSAGFEVRGVTVLVDGRVARRWQFGAPNFTQWMVAISIGVTAEARPPRQR